MSLLLRPIWSPPIPGRPYRHKFRMSKVEVEGVDEDDEIIPIIVAIHEKRRTYA